MKKEPKVIIFLLRLTLAWIFLYSSISKIIANDWTSANFLKEASTLKPLFDWFASPQNIDWVDFLNIYGQLALGIALLLGIFLPVAAIGGVAMMTLYYLAQLHFPYVGRGTLFLLIDDHVIYSLCLLLLWKVDAGRYLGLKTKVAQLLGNRLQKLN